VSAGRDGATAATGAKVFSTTLARDREALGETITRWIAAHPELEMVGREVRQSSDRQFHCLSITLFYRERRDG
jgi:folate-dependent tRNA-U54 methylase TrmFO/GidA